MTMWPADIPVRRVSSSLRKVSVALMMSMAAFRLMRVIWTRSSRRLANGGILSKTAVHGSYRFLAMASAYQTCRSRILAASTEAERACLHIDLATVGSSEASS